jgi:PAS domain S-box-containing protein
MITGEVDRLLVDVTHLNQLATEAYTQISQQQNVLRLRGIQLDAALLEELHTLQSELGQVVAFLTAQQPELLQLRALVRATAVFNSTLNLEQVLADVMDNFIGLTDAERGLIVLIDPQTRELEFRVIRGMDEKGITKTNFLVSRTVVKEVAATGQPVMTNNAMEDERYQAQESIISYAARSLLCVPLKVKNEVIGVAYADHRYKDKLFGNHEITFLEGYANQAAISIENARLFDEIQRQLREITEIRNFLDNIFSSIESGIITLDNQGIVLTVNRAAEDILGIRASSSFDKSYREVLPPLFEGFDHLLEDVRQNRIQQSIEINPVLPHRGPVNLYLKLSPLIEADQARTLGVAIVIDDLTEQKKQEETLRVVNTYLPSEMVSNIQDLDKFGLGGETREISAIFADVRGFTTFSEQLEPEVLMGIINQYLSVSSDAVQNYQGIIDKFMGDAILGLYNTQLNPQEDHAMRCVVSAIRIVQAVQTLHKHLPPDQQLLYGIGVHTGLATIGNIGSPSRKEFTAIGEAVDMAKKLQECAAGGEIILSESTYEQVKSRIHCERVERQLRNQSEYKPMYVVRGVIRT